MLDQGSREKIGRCERTGRLRAPLLSAILLTGVAWRAVVGEVLGNGSNPGRWAITGVEYNNVYTRYAIDRNLLKTYSIRDRDAKSAKAVFECTKACLSTPGCVSFVHNPAHRRCFLTKSDRCAAPGDVLLYAAGYHTYEIKSGGDPDKDVTCLASCRAVRSCGECGRAQCQGHMCDQCNNACWLIDPRISGTMEIYVTLSTPKAIVCQGVWQRVWTGRLDLYSQLLVTPLKLKVVMRYEGEVANRVAFFSSVVFRSGLMSVGDYTGGEAGNGWDAPFHERRERYDAESNCRLFYYDEGLPCRANGVMPYEDQLALNYTTIKRGYYWGSDNETLANTPVLFIHLYITAIDS